MPKKKVDVLLIALSSPIHIGIYENNLLIDVIEKKEKSSDILPLVYKNLLEQYDIQNLFYANGPGSFMAIKVAYIFLKSLSILKNIPLLATDAFKFNNNAPIKAFGKLYFVNINSKIQTQKFEIVEEGIFVLPKHLIKEEFSTNTMPLYKIGAVG